VHANFYSFEAAERFDAVCYWNGFGIGTDADQHALTELTDFDPVACRFTDTWWEQDQPGQRHTQTGRCYTPADFRLLHRDRPDPSPGRAAQSPASTRRL
jgi:hypothetical protein